MTIPNKAHIQRLLERIIKTYEPDELAAERELRWMVEELETRRRSKRHFLPNDYNIAKESLLSLKQLDKLEYWVSQRARGKPLQYVLGSQQFAGLEIKLRQPVLIPRWETEEWTMRLIESLKPKSSSTSLPLRILELCSGTGCIALALAHHLPRVKIDSLDISQSAITLARLNQRRLGISTHQLKFHKFDLFNLKREGPFRGYDVVVSNPPYISHEEFKSLDASVRDFEDEWALRTRDKDGVEFYEFIANSSDFLFHSKSQSKLIVEIGETQGPLVEKILKDANFSNIQIFKDLAGSDRSVEGMISLAAER